MSLFNIILLTASFALAPAYLCRLDALHVRQHRMPVVMLHLLLFVGCISAGYHAWLNAGDLSDVCAVGAAALWIATSWQTWRHGVPAHVLRAAPVGQSMLARLASGRGRGRP